jgi:hypothetical protein
MRVEASQILTLAASGKLITGEAHRPLLSDLSRLGVKNETAEPNGAVGTGPRTQQ